MVLAGGGSAGNAWEIGVVAGLFDAGLDVTEADLIIGTSAGSTVAAQITGAMPSELLAAILSEAPQRRTGRGGPEGGGAPLGPVANHMEITSRIIAAADGAADMRRRMGAAALEMGAASDGFGQARWRAVVAARLPRQCWPIWQPDTRGCWCCRPSVADHGIRWSGACTLRYRSTNSARAAARSRRSSRTAARSPRSVST